MLVVKKLVVGQGFVAVAVVRAGRAGQQLAMKTGGGLKLRCFLKAGGQPEEQCCRSFACRRQLEQGEHRELEPGESVWRSGWCKHSAGRYRLAFVQ